MKNDIKNFANIAAGAVLEDTSLLFVNEFTVAADRMRWVCLAPYGDWPNKQGLQRFTKSDATTIVNEFHGILNTPQRVLGAPWYVGHPDHPAFNERYKDTKAYGRIKQLEAREDGLWAGVKFNGDGEKLIADESFHGHSVNWFLKQDQQDKRAWRPFRLKSVGFTNEPNIPVLPVTTANEVGLAGNELMQAHFKKLARHRLFANANDNHDERGRFAAGGATSAEKADQHAKASVFHRGNAALSADGSEARKFHEGMADHHESESLKHRSRARTMAKLRRSSFDTDAEKHLSEGKTEEQFLGQAKYGVDRNKASSAWRSALDRRAAVK